MTLQKGIKFLIHKSSPVEKIENINNKKGNKSSINLIISKFINILPNNHSVTGQRASENTFYFFHDN